MASEQKKHFRICRHGPLAIRVWSVIFGIALTPVSPAALKAQQASTAVYIAGNAAVTGFSGVLPPAQIAAGVDPNQKTFIDLNGPTLRVVDLQHMGGPAVAQLVGAPKPFTFSAAQTGQVFGVALDDASPPNIYAAASSAYGLPIVAPGPDGQPLHIQTGAPNATFMPGLWGSQGGPGSIWRIDGVTGNVSLFANVASNNRANSGAALGGFAYDPDSKSLYVADRESGLIHRLGLNGSDLGTYDHGMTGRAAQGLPPLPWTSQQPINIASPQFDSGQPATWNYAPPARRVFGLAVHERRLYYAVADSLQIWSVGLNPNGSFANDAVIELAASPSTGPTEISKITFDEQGRMFLADRPAPTGAFDFEALAVPAIGRVLRYAVVEIMPNGRRIWQQQPDEYAIGFPSDFRNGNGGVAIGYNYDAVGEIIPGSCGGFMWTTGEDLRQPSDPVLAAQLGQSGPLDVNGLQGNGTWRIRRHDEPPLESYFVDYNDEYDDPAERGHMGDVAIERLCSPAQRADLIPFGGAPPFGAPPSGVPPRAGNPPGPPNAPPNIPGPPPNTPPSGCQPGQLRRAGTGECGSCSSPNIQINGTCCSATQLAATAVCSNSSCQPGQTPIGPSNFCCNNSQVYSGAGGAQACCGSPLVNGKCPTPIVPPIMTCGKGYVPVGGACCLSSKVTSTGVCCPAGETPSGPNKSQCEKIVIIPIKLPPGPQCCASGIPTASGKCCPPANVTTSGVCCSGPVDPKNRKECQTLIPLASCASGYTKMPDGSCCNNRFVGADGKSCNVNGQPCPSGEFRNERGFCISIPTTSCPPGNFRTTSGACLPIPSTACPPGGERDREGKCVTVPTRNCPPGETRDREGACVPERPAACPPGEIRDREGACVPARPVACPPGEIRDRNGNCVRAGPPPRLIVPGRPPGPVPPPRIFLPRPPGPVPPPGIFVPRRPEP
jgi:hypothetical protein